MKPLEMLAKLPGVLLPWYDKNKRDLPWRQDREPYHIWLSEIMLQQTRVEAVKGYYARFLAALPTVEALAFCDDDALHKLWEGLGYYSRVRNLKKAANVILAEHGGVFPRTYEEVLALPGIGEYTAGAICSICFCLPTPAVDGNVLRVVSRLLDDDTPIDEAKQKKRIQQLLQQIYPAKAGDFTQALMELGATVCGPNRKPDCGNCPCREFCLAHIRGREEALPVKKPKKGRREEDRTVFILHCDGCWALCKRPETGLLASLWQFPDMPGKLMPQQAMSWASKQGLQPRELCRQRDKNHIFTHIQWNLTGYYMEVDCMAGDYWWASREEVEEKAALPTAYRQFWEVGTDV